MPHPVVDEYLEPVYSWIESSFGIEPAYVQLGIMLLGIVALWFVIPDIKRKTPEQMDPGSSMLSFMFLFFFVLSVVVGVFVFFFSLDFYLSCFAFCLISNTGLVLILK